MYWKYRNELREFQSKRPGADHGKKFLSVTEFEQKFGPPPWDLFNSLMEDLQLPYQVTNPTNDPETAAFTAMVTGLDLDTPINFSDLSSGEKVIMSLVFALYNSTSAGNFPKAILLDEADSSLHPGYIRTFLDVIKSLFQERLKIPVLMATHSPTTVALADDKSLYLVNRKAPRIEKVDKYSVLKALTVGIPTLTIRNENKKQIFVESLYDAHFFTGIQEALIGRLSPDVALTFLHLGKEKGGKNLVLDLVEKLRSSGNETVFGIIDWDGENSPTRFVHVLGHGARDSIESFIFDPMIIGTYLVLENQIEFASLGLKHNRQIFEIDTFTADQAQHFATCVVKAILPELDVTGEFVIAQYQVGWELKIPAGYLQMDGHELEEKIKNKFKTLLRFRNEWALKAEVMEKVIRRFPDLLPKDLLTLLQTLQSA